MNEPLVSICIPAYNAAPFITETIVCFINQTYQNIEIIIQDDYSKDDTYNIALNLAQKDERIKVYQNEHNLGIGKNWNKCYEKATGEFIIIANADDIYNADLIKNGLNIFVNNPKADSLSFCYEIYNDITSSTTKLPFHKNLKVGFQKNLFELAFFHNPFHIVFSIFKKSSLNKILIDNKLFLETQVCDAELFFRIGKNNLNHYYSNYIAGKYRKHPNNNSLIVSGESNSWLYDVLPLYKKHLKDNFRSKSLKLFRAKILHHLKYSIKNRGKFFNKYLKTLVQYYISIV